MVSVLNTLGAGSGVDTTALIDALVAAERGSRDALIATRTTRVEARVSGLAQLGSGLSALVTALASRTRGGALGPLPGSSDATIVAASATRGVTPLLSPVTIEVRSLAGGQTLVSTPLASVSAPVGHGRLTLRVGTMTPDGQGGFGFAGNGATPVEVTIDATNDSLTGLRDAINAAHGPAPSGIVASIVADAGTARLVLKGQAGAGAAFILTADPAGAGPGLDRFVHNPATSAMTVAANARDASLVLDGVPVTRPGNNFSDLVDGVTLDLRRASPGSMVTIAATRDADGLKSAVRDLVTALDAMNSLTAGLVRSASATEAAGALAGDATVRSTRNGLLTLTSTSILTGAGEPVRRLADLGVVTARDGGLSIDEARLGAAIAAAPDGVERLLVALTASGTGPLARISAGLASDGVGGTNGRNRREQVAVVRDKAALDTRMAAYRATLVRQYAAMESAVAASKSTQSFLDAQIKAWNRSDT